MTLGTKIFISTKRYQIISMQPRLDKLVYR